MSFIPYHILTDIIRRVGREGFRELAPFIAAGPGFKAIVFSDDVLSVVDIDEFIFVMGLSDEGSPYRSFLLRCLAA
ncbi:hypothetical protein V5N11_008706 [Cardamine amara subsp. amara]|uniref:Uncharacterized protein n=1 Tax=Cardamine amara subsp. amara TaxID=228776 RepID=A0ABD1BUB9_CARAN